MEHGLDVQGDRAKKIRVEIEGILAQNGEFPKEWVARISSKSKDRKVM